MKCVDWLKEFDDILQQKTMETVGDNEKFVMWLEKEYKNNVLGAVEYFMFWKNLQEKAT